MNSEQILNPIYYVLGFGFSDEKLVLIEKDRPENQKGKLNGVGGKINESENAWQAMTREFMEETSVYIPPTAWTNVGRMVGVDGQGKSFHVEVFVVDDHECESARTMESERVVIVDWQTYLAQHNGRREVRAMENLSALITLCRLNMSGHGPTFALTYDE